MHTANQPYNVLDGATKQKNPRSADDLARLNRYAPVLRSYCAAGDPVCAAGEVVADHLNYFELYTDEASSWVVSKIDGTADLCPAPSSSAPAPSSSTPAPATSSTAASSSTLVSAASSTDKASTSTGAASSATKVTYPTAAYPTSSSVVTPAPFPEPIGYEEECHVVYEVHYKYE